MFKTTTTRLADNSFGHLHFDFGNLNLPFDLAQGGELVEPFRISTRPPRLARMAGRYSIFGFDRLT